METLKQGCFLLYESANKKDKECANASKAQTVVETKSGTAASRKTRAKKAMKLAEANYANACSDINICVQEELLILVDVFLAETLPRIASLVMSPTQDVLQWVDQNGKKEDWDKLSAYVMESDRAPDATLSQSRIS